MSDEFTASKYLLPFLSRGFHGKRDSRKSLGRLGELTPPLNALPNLKGGTMIHLTHLIDGFFYSVGATTAYFVVKALLHLIKLS